MASSLNKNESMDEDFKWQRIEEFYPTIPTTATVKWMSKCYLKSLAVIAAAAAAVELEDSSSGGGLTYLPIVF